MKVCLEATSLQGRRSGVGFTTHELALSLIASDPELELVLFSMGAERGDVMRDLANADRVQLRGGRPWNRAIAWLWWRSDAFPAERLCGDVDVFHGPNYLLPPLRKAAGVLTLHDLAFLRMPEDCPPDVRKLADAVPLTTSRAQRVIVPSEFVAREVRELLPAVADRVRVVPMAVRRAFLEPVSPRHMSRRPFAVFVSNLERRKGVDVLLRAFASVRRDVPEAGLVLIGQPSFGWQEIGDENVGLLSSGDVTTMGYTSDEEAAALISAARVLVYPSRYEGFGLPPLEAMACGTPAIVTNTGPLPEVCGAHARYVEVDDADGLAATMVEALTNTPDATAIEAARAHALSFSWVRTAAATLDVYREAMGAR